MLFRYSTEIIKQFPLTVGGLIHLKSGINGPTSERLKEVYTAEQQAVIDRLGNTPLSELPSLNAWRQAFRQFGVNPTKTR